MSEILFAGGLLWTGRQDRAEPGDLLSRDGVIVAVGPDAAAGAGSGAEVVAIDGRVLMAGFQDAHVHPIHGGLNTMRCDLEPVVGAAEAASAIAAYVTRHPAEPWILGGGWSYDWYPRGCPNATALDQVTDGRPAYLRVRDGHSGWANHAALARAGIAASTPDPPDGRIERNEDGTPQGTLHEGAMDLVERLIPPPDPSTLDEALDAGQARLFSCGVTAWQDAWVTVEDDGAYRRAAADGRLRAEVRAAAWWDREQGMEQLPLLLERTRRGAPGYEVGTVKLMLDGVCENFTAAMLEPYLSAPAGPSEAGIDFIDQDVLVEAVTALDAVGRQCHFHAIGDRAVRNALDAVEAARKANGYHGTRHHIAHIQVVHPADIPRFAALDVVANCQPLWACNDHAMTELTLPFLGEERGGWQYPFESLRRAGARLAMGSDWPVSSPDVMAQIDTFVTRTESGAGGEAFLPGERISLPDALRAATVGSAFVNHLESRRGSLTVGNVSDLVVLDRDPFGEGAVSDVAVEMTVVGGAVVFERGR